MTETSYAQFRTDLALARHFPPDHVGTYLDVGAHHPIIGSNTYLFYLRGWRGVTVEPAVAPYRLHRDVRPDDRSVNVAISNKDGEAVFFEMDEASVSTLDEHEASLRIARGQGSRPRTVETVTVRTLLDRLVATPGWVRSVKSGPDILSIDVEGHERQVLEGCPFDEGWRPRVIVLEACYPCTRVPCSHLWEDILHAHGYGHMATCGVNRIYIDTSVPPC